MEKIGPDATTSHQLYPASKKATYTLVTTVNDGNGFSQTKPNLKAKQLASAALDAYKTHLKKAAKSQPSAASNGSKYFQKA